MQREAQMRGRTVGTKMDLVRILFDYPAFDAVIAAVLFATLKFAVERGCEV